MEQLNNLMSKYCKRTGYTMVNKLGRTKKVNKTEKIGEKYDILTV